MSDAPLKQARVLVVGRKAVTVDLARTFEPFADLQQVQTIEDAIQQVRAGGVDLIVAAPDDLLPLEGTRSVEHAAAIIDSVGHGAGVVDESGEIVWANPRLLALPADVTAKVTRLCVEAARTTSPDQRGQAASRTRRSQIRSAQNEHFEVAATPIFDGSERITQVAVVVQDVTNARRLQDTVDAIERAGQELVNLDAQALSRMDARERLAFLEKKILRCTKDILHFDNFHIRVLNRRSNRLDPVLTYGLPQSVSDTELYATPEGNGISGWVAARGRSYICPDVRNDPRYLQGIDQAMSSLTVPLKLQDEVVGVANFESTRLAGFNENDRQFAEIFGRYIAMSLHVLELLVSERYTTTGQLGRNVMAEITGPLNDILTDVESLVEDYIGHDDLRHRLRRISSNAIDIRSIIKELTSERAGILGVKAAAGKPKDPHLCGKRILIADDEEIIRETVRDVLSSHGCTVVTAADGAEAIQQVQSQPFDLVLSDIQMPLKNGYEVFAASKQTNAAVPVILTTGFGYDPNHSIVRARREGLASVLFKPFKVDQLIGEVRAALQAHKG